jgi:hypothetical protein
MGRTDVHSISFAPPGPIINKIKGNYYYEGRKTRGDRERKELKLVFFYFHNSAEVKKVVY